MSDFCVSFLFRLFLTPCWRDAAFRYRRASRSEFCLRQSHIALDLCVSPMSRAPRFFISFCQDSGPRGAAWAQKSEDWVPEGNLAAFFVRHHFALELVRGADFPWKLMCGAGPGDLGVSRVSMSAENTGKRALKQKLKKQN